LTHVYGPYFYHCNISPTPSRHQPGRQTLYAERWLKPLPTNRLAVFLVHKMSPTTLQLPAGHDHRQMAIADSYNPNASASNLWVGLVQQPSSTAGNLRFQEWQKPYHFWTRTDANGNFSIPGVIAAGNYTLYAFGPGAAGTFQSQPNPAAARRTQWIFQPHPSFVNRAIGFALTLPKIPESDIACVGCIADRN